MSQPDSRVRRLAANWSLGRTVKPGRTQSSSVSACSCRTFDPTTCGTTQARRAMLTYRSSRSLAVTQRTTTLRLAVRDVGRMAHERACADRHHRGSFGGSVRVDRAPELSDLDRDPSRGAPPPRGRSRRHRSTGRLRVVDGRPGRSPRTGPDTRARRRRDRRHAPSRTVPHRSPRAITPDTVAAAPHRSPSSAPDIRRHDDPSSALGHHVACDHCGRNLVLPSVVWLYENCLSLWKSRSLNEPRVLLSATA